MAKLVLALAGVTNLDQAFVNQSVQAIAYAAKTYAPRLGLVTPRNVGGRFQGSHKTELLVFSERGPVGGHSVASCLLNIH